MFNWLKSKDIISIKKKKTMEYSTANLKIHNASKVDYEVNEMGK